MAGTEFIRVDEWVPNPEDNKVLYDGKLVVIPFDKLFNKQDNDALNTFIIKKESYVKRLPDLCHYINYFIKYYDYDNELLMAYFKLKFLIDNKASTIGLGAYIKFVYNILLSDSMVKKIIDLVEDNYYIDLTSDSGKTYNESLEFTKEHAKVMMQISMAMKLMVPVMFHYMNTYGLIKHRQYIFRFYEGLFDLFGGDEIDIYNKLWISIYSKVNVNHVRNRVIWEQREIFGTDPLTHMVDLLKDKIISETFFKYTFNKNIISFNYVVLDRQLRFFIIEPYKTNRIELSAKKDVSGLSGIDKLEMNSTKLDESTVILSSINIKKTIKRIKKSMHVDITKEEIEFYKNNLKITKFQSQLVFYYYAKYFGGYRDMNLLNRTQYLKLLIILKKRLQYQKFVYLPQVLTANIENRLNSRTIRNDKFLTKIGSSSIYKSIVADKYSMLDDLNKPDLIINLLSTILNTTFTFVDYEHPDMTGKVIEVDQDAVSDEFLNFLNQL